MDIDPLRLAFLADPNSIHSRRWIGWFAERGHDTHLLVPDDVTVLPGLPASTRVWSYPAYGRARGRVRRALRARASLRSLFREIEPDVVHAHYVTTSGWNAWLARRHPLVVTAWGSDIYVNTRDRRGTVLTGAVLRAADLVTADSDDLAAACVRAGADAGRVRIVQFGVDVDRFAATADGAEMRSRLDLADRRIVLAPRRIARLYRQLDVVDALATLPEDVAVVFSRQGAEPTELERLEGRVTELGLDDRVRLVSGFSHPEMPAAYAAADVVVSVPSSDGTPVTLLEAMASDRPVVATDLPSVREWLGDVDPSALVPVGDVSAIAGAIRAHLEWDDQQRDGYRERARSAVRERADRDASMERMEAAYDDLRRGDPRSRRRRPPRPQDGAAADASLAAGAEGPIALAILGDPESIHVRRWVSGFAARGHRVSLLVPRGLPISPGLDPRVEVRSFTAYPTLPVRGLGSLVTRISLGRALRGVGAEILHAHYLGRYGWMARLSGFSPYVITVWGSDVLVAPRTSRRARLWGRLALRGASRVTAVSDALAEAAIRLGARPERVRIVQFGVDATTFSPGEASDDFRERFDLRPRLILSPRAVDPNFRHDVVLRALARLPDDVVVAFIDAGHDPEERQRLERLASDLSIADRVRWLDPVAHDRMPDLFRAAEVVVSIPRSDAFPVTALEAMACGIPIVLSGLASAREGLGRVDPSALVSGEDPVELAGAIEARLSLTPEARQELGARLRAAAIERGDVTANLERMELAYRAVLRS